jgi:hypothetical protein
MVSRAAFAFAFVMSCASCSADSGSAAQQGLLLHGFRLVDPSDRSVREADLCIARGAVRACEPSESARYQRIEGKGRFLLPALWDLNASLWGNISARKYDDIYQEMTISQTLRVQLYYGVAHVGTFAMNDEWVSREVKRARALEFPAAELLFPDKALGGKESFACVAVQREAELPALLEQRQSHAAPYVLLVYGDPESKDLPGLSRALLAEALTQAARRSLKGYVLVDTWQRAREAAELGAALLYGSPQGELTQDLIALLRDKAVAFAPDLSGLELARVLGAQPALKDPFLSASVSELVLSTFREPNGLWVGWRPALARAQQSQVTLLADLRRLSDAGVHLVQGSGAGWKAGSFQGYSTHSAQVWLEQAGVAPWSRLAAVTVWPAALVGRRVSFAPDAPADFVALDADPLSQASNLRRLSFLIRDGRVIDRVTLEPDLTRDKFRP